MPDQLNMFSGGIKYIRGSATSKAAAEELTTSKTLRGQVYRMLVTRGNNGATDEEMQQWCHMNPSSQRPRRIELVSMQLAQDSGRTRPTRAGRSAVVWVAQKAT